MTDKISKDVGSNYQYETTGPAPNLVQGGQKIPGLLPDGSVDPNLLNRDQLSKSDKEEKRIGMLQIDAPELPIPTRQARNKAATNEDIKQKHVKSQGGPPSEPSIWLKNPSLIGALYAATSKITDFLSQGKEMSAKMSINLSDTVYQLGLETAQLAKDLRMNESHKELVQAFTKFASATIGVFQLAGMSKARETSKETADTKFKAKMDSADADIAKTNAKLNPSTATDQNNQVKQALQPEKQEKLTKRLAEQEKHKQKIESDRQDFLYRETDINIRTNDNRWGIFTHMAEGVGGVVSSLFTAHGGSIEKLKGEIDALNNYLAKLLEKINQEEREDSSSLKEYWQSFSQNASSLSAHLSSRG